MNDREDISSYVGQVERDPQGLLWAVLYHGDEAIIKEQVRSLRRGKRRVADLVLGAADTFPEGPRRPARTHLNRVVEDRARTSRRRRAHIVSAA